MKEWRCTKEMSLIDFLEEVSSFSHKKAKALLKYEKVYVNGKVRTFYNYPLHEKDRVCVDLKTKKLPETFKILYEDDDIIVVTKKEGLLTVSTEKEKENTLYHMVREYVKEKNPHTFLFVVHRLDRETSGIVVFAKKEKVKRVLQENWNEWTQKRGYTAVLDGSLPQKEGTLISYLTEKKDRVYSSKSPKDGKKAITKYTVLKKNNSYTLVDIALETGRKNQIRVQFSSLGYPIVGDRKYGNSAGPLKRMALHAGELYFTHPTTHRNMRFIEKAPASFERLLKVK